MHSSGLSAIYTETISCWLAAEDALHHVRCNSAKIATIFSRWQIPESEYAVCAGFDEDLICAGVGYLEQVHVFTSASLANNGLLLNELGKIFIPFSAILFTPSTSFPIPTFKKDGATCNFDELVFSSASKFLDAGSSATSLPTIISLVQNKPYDDSLSGLSNGGNGGGSEDSGQGGNSDGDRKEGDDSHREEGCNEGGRGDDDPSGDDPEGPDKPGGSIHHPQVFFDVLSKIYCSDDTKQQGAVQAIFQDLNVTGALKIMVSIFKAYLPSIYIFGSRHGRLRLGLEATLEHAKSTLPN
jgi:hypothetical protein